MKRVGLLLTCLVLFCGLLVAQNEKISVNEKEHDFGVIGDADGYASFDFVITNNTDAPLVITRVHTSCGCTSSDWTKEPIEKGKTGKISVIFNPAGQVGSFGKSVEIQTNQAPVYLSIKGTVVKSETIVKKKTPEEEYPVAIGGYRFKTKELAFDKVDLKEKKTITLEVFNNSDKPITQKVQKLPKYITVAFNPAVIPAKTAATVNVNLEILDPNLYGDLAGEITLMIDNVRQSFPYSAKVVEDFSKWTAYKKANAGKINVNSNEINFGNFTSGDSRTLKISNSGKSPLNVHTIKASDEAITVSKSNFIINPGEITEIKINANNKKIQSNFSSILTIISDDPTNPAYDVVIKSNKKL